MVTQNSNRIDCRYEGLSTDTKPTDVPVNSIFWSLDENKEYYFDGSSWSAVGGEDAEK